jgi:hypothetical protein
MTNEADELIARMWKRYERVLVQGQGLGDSIQSWLSAHPMSVRAEIVEDRLSWQLIVDIDQPPLDDWGHAFGEAVHNLRACLDNLAWALANLDGSPSKPKRVQFPIVKDKSDWNAGKSRIAELPDSAQRAIEQLQPFQRTGGSDGTAGNDQLVLLADFSNTDKHRVALLPEVGYESIEHAFAVKFRSEDDAAAEGAPNVEFDLGPLRTGGVIMRQVTRHPIDSVQGSLNINARVVVLHPDHPPAGVTQSLAEMAQYVKLVVEHVLQVKD